MDGGECHCGHCDPVPKGDQPCSEVASSAHQRPLPVFLYSHFPWSRPRVGTWVDPAVLGQFMTSDVPWKLLC